MTRPAEPKTWRLAVSVMLTATLFGALLLGIALLLLPHLFGGAINSAAGSPGVGALVAEHPAATALAATAGLVWKPRRPKHRIGARRPGSARR